MISMTSSKTIALAGKYQAQGIVQTLSEIGRFLIGAGHRVVLEEETANRTKLFEYAALTVAQIAQHADLAIVVGGDGTMLSLARQLAPFDVPMIGINQGRLGFMTDISLEAALPTLDEILQGNYAAEKRSLLVARVLREGTQIYAAESLNDVVVARGASAGMVELQIEVDGYFMYRQRSDGLIVSTPTGSTAYALSAGGPLLHPNLGGLVLVPIAPHALSNRPIVISDHAEIVIQVIDGREASVNFDMQSLTHLQHQDRIVIKRSPHTITFLHPAHWNYYATLRHKLHWHDLPSQETS